MKKILCYLFITSMLIVSCGGCGKKKDTDIKEQDKVETEVEKDTQSDNEKKPENTDNKEISKAEHMHTYKESVVNATCTSSGTQTYTCSSCSHSYSENIPQKGHSWQYATCTSPKTCSVCNTTEGTALGHSKNSNGNCERCGVTLIVISDAEREKYTVAACAMNWFFKTSKFPRTVCFTNAYYTADNGYGRKIWLIEGYGENNFGGNSYAYVSAKLNTEPIDDLLPEYPDTNYKISDNLYANTSAGSKNPYSNSMSRFTEKLDKTKLEYMYYQLFNEYDVQFD